ncbi:hypothetical protein GJ629_00510 [Halapricum sp. CBA1109]|uniref:hypothetical protein n=1 Tax=Halapricum sp. CBA1109 TaxID=2668068 RepID=UPI0012FCF7FF|nr:hypothetical protein [Halapricum sp. CBA1109]MUV88552.1 hypothetical protein [Halapricum sp. CBA1109]
MSESRGRPELEVLVVTEDRSFGSGVVDAIERTEGAPSGVRVEPAVEEAIQRDTSSLGGAVVDGQIAEPVAVIERFIEEAGLPVVVLSESGWDDETIARVIEAGATDVFPRTTANAQYESPSNGSLPIAPPRIRKREGRLMGRHMRRCSRKSPRG